MAKSRMQRWRTRLSRFLGALLLIAVGISGSAWEEAWHPMTSLLFFAGCILAAIGSLGRLWCSLYIAGNKTERLVTKGPYSITRHPLYLFSLIGALGVGFASETLTIPALILIAFAAYYPAVIKAEEGRLSRMHGEKYAEYVSRTPRFFPKMSLLSEPEEYSIHPVRFRKDAFNALWFIWFIGILEVIEDIHGVFPPLFKIY